MAYKTNRKTKGKFRVRERERHPNRMTPEQIAFFTGEEPKELTTEQKILKEFGIKELTPRVDIAVAMVRKQQRNPKPDYLVRWRAYTKDFTEAEWDELTRRLLIQT